MSGAGLQIHQVAEMIRLIDLVGDYWVSELLKRMMGWLSIFHIASETLAADSLW